MVEHVAVQNTSEPQWSLRDKESNLANHILLFIQIHMSDIDSNSPQQTTNLPIKAITEASNLQKVFFEIFFPTI